MDDLNLREILVKKPFRRILSNGYRVQPEVTDADMYSEIDDAPLYQIVTQGDFLREFYPSGHAINSKEFYPDIIKQDPETKQYFTEAVERCAFAFQREIAVKHTTHLTGNDIQFELPNSERNMQNEEMDELFNIFRKGWAEKDMEVRFYESVWSYKVTGDTALVGYIKNGKFGCKTLSYLNGDTLYPHFDSLTGELILFARKYYDYDEDGGIRNEWVEVWDSQNLTRFKRDAKSNSAKTIISKLFKLDGYAKVSQRPHGFQFIPIAYHRDEIGACWSPSQDSIDHYEIAFSQLAQNNKAYAFPIMYFKGSDVEIKGDMGGAVKSILMDEDGDAGFLNRQEVSEAFNKQLNVLYKMIYEQSFAVQPPELKSGDLPGVAVKLLFSPAYENAINDALSLNEFLDDMIRIFKAGYGTEIGKYSRLMGFNVNAWIEPYIHQNDTELITNLAQGVQNDFISRQTASERANKYTKNDEFDRIMREKKRLQEMDILEAAANEEIQVEGEVDKQVKLNQLTGGQDVNTGNRKVGRPNLSGKEWDENGNNPIDDANNWDDYNRKH